MTEPDRAGLLASLARDLSHASGAETAPTITETAVRHVKDADAASVTLRARRGRHISLGATDALARDADELQYRLDEGPCVEAAEGHDWFRSGDVAHDRRWPAWGPQAAQLGVGSMLSVRLMTDGTPMGAINYYSRRVGAFDDRDEVEFGLLYATHVAIALTSSRQVEGLESALHSRHVIGMAQGVLIERFGLDIDQSFALLRRYSSHGNRKILDVAEEIVRTRRLPGDARVTAPPG